MAEWPLKDHFPNVPPLTRGLDCYAEVRAMPADYTQTIVFQILRYDVTIVLKYDVSDILRYDVSDTLRYDVTIVLWKGAFSSYS